MIDENGFRLNVGMVLINSDNKVLLGRRTRSASAWQFPQGGIHRGETEQQAMFRELHEELGLTDKDVQIISETREWLYYNLPDCYQRRTQPLCIGQKQKWFLLKLLSKDNCIELNICDRPEFDQWRWVDFWFPLEAVIDFKREVYRQVLDQFASSQGLGC